MSAKPTLQRTRLAVIAALSLLAPAAEAASGSFTFVTGDVAVTKVNGQRLTAARGVEVDPGDLIATGASGMAQLTMIDKARLSLRPNTQFRIEQYQRSADSAEGAVLNLLRGTLRTFTGLIAAQNREKFVMKTRVATVGIRGSGNILYACSGRECDESVASGATGDVAVNHTIEGSHAVTNLVDAAPGLPPQQGGAQTLITGPGQTVLIAGGQAPRYIPTPQFIADTATNPTGTAKASQPDAGGTGSDAQATRNFAPGDNRAVPSTQQGSQTPVGNNPLGFVIIDASGNVGADPTNLRDVIIASSGPFLGQASASNLNFDGASNTLRGYTSYAGSLTDLQPAMVGGEIRENRAVSVGGVAIVMGRWEGAGLGFNGAGSAVPVAGNLHWIYGQSGFPTYLSDVLTGTATYTLAAATSPTNQNNTPGTLGSATLNVNFTNRTLGLQMGVTMPAAGSNGGGSWNISADNVAFSLNTFFATTGDRLVIINGTGQSSATNGALSGAIEGSFVGLNLSAAILGFGISDQTATSAANHNTVTGVAALAGPAQNGAAAYREGRVSDPNGFLASSDFSRNYATTNRPEEVTSDSEGRVTAFVAPYGGLGSRASYSLGTAQVVQSGFDAETGLVWGRWGNGVANVSAGGQNQALNLSGQSLHYIFAGQQQGPVALPLTGTGVYDVIGSTAPTDNAGHVGTLGSATLQANFTNRTAQATVNVSIAGQNWIGTAPNMPIYRDQYFGASTGSSLPGVTNVSPFAISCNPGCGAGATGSLDGFFTGRSGQRAGVLYNMGGVQGAVAFGRRGG